MTIKPEEKIKLRQTVTQMKHELGALSQVLDSMPEHRFESGYNAGSLAGYDIDEYLLGFRLGNISDLSLHLLERFKLAKGTGASG